MSANMPATLRAGASNRQTFHCFLYFQQGQGTVERDDQQHSDPAKFGKAQAKTIRARVIRLDAALSLQ